MAGKHPVSVLQELMAQQRGELPKYEIADISTRTTPRFRCTVKVAGIVTSTESSSKQVAKKQAASQAIDLLGYNISKTRHVIHEISYNAIGTLNEYTAQKRLQYPTYTECGVNTRGDFIISCKVHQYTCEACASTKKHAKQLAAHNMLEKLKTQGMNIITMPAVKAEISDDDVLKKFKQLSLENASALMTKTESVQSKPVDHSLNGSNEYHEDVKDSDNPEDLLEIKEKLHKLNVDYSVSVMKTKPYTMVLKFDGEQQTTIVATDESYDAAHYKLFKRALIVASALIENNK